MQELDLAIGGVDFIGKMRGGIGGLALADGILVDDDYGFSFLGQT